jgi:hypothetical protein
MLHFPMNHRECEHFDTELRRLVDNVQNCRVTTMTMTSRFFATDGFDSDGIANQLESVADKDHEFNIPGLMFDDKPVRLDVNAQFHTAIMLKATGVCVKVFRNGAIHMTGLKCASQGAAYVDAISRFFDIQWKGTVTVCMCNILVATGSSVSFRTVRIHAMNSDWCDMLDRERFSGLRLKNKKKHGTILFTRNGNCVLTGFDSILDMEITLDWLDGFFFAHGNREA